MLFRRALLFAVAAAPLALADVQFTTPAAGATLTGGSTITIEWKDSGNAPSISDLTSYQLFLCAGGNDQPVQLAALQSQGTFGSGNSASGTVQANLGGDTTNAYFLKMISVAAAGGTVINYSDRFSLSGMTGVFPASITSALANIKGTSGPPTQNQVAGAGAGAAGPAGPYTLPYTLQTGLTRYAPMAPLPPTKITKKNPSPQYPTSAVTLAKTFLPTPSIVTTLTQSQTASAASRVNTAAAAPQPSNDMSRFLARWKD